MMERSAVTELVSRGWRRQVRNLLIQEASFAAAIALGGAFLLLVLGTQILNWYWLVILFAGSMGVGIYRGRRRLHTRYSIAQEIDARLGLHDAVSTAYYFGLHPDRAATEPEIVERQSEVAEQLARSADLRQGVPFIAPRSFYLNAALGLAVCAMFGLRYGITHSMDLRASLVHVSFEGFFSSSREVADAKRARQMRPFEPDGGREENTSADAQDSKMPQMDQSQETPQDALADPDPNMAADSQSNSKKNAPGADQDQMPGKDPLDSSEKNDSQQSSSDSKADSGKSAEKSNDGSKENNPKGGNQSGNPGDNSSLADKMKDALSNLLSKLKTPPKPTEGNSSNNSQGSPRQSQNQDAKSKPNPSQQQSEANGSSQSQPGDQSQSESQQAAQGKNNSSKPSEQGNSGIGHQDGEKQTQDAEQLAAMGKISEILGKRAVNVSGEVMVEVASGKQQLKTQYSQQNATHGDAGGEVSRDEIPLAYQHYVEQYFEEVRKTPGVKGKLDPKVKGSGN